MDTKDIFTLKHIKPTPIRTKLMTLFLKHKQPIFYKTIESFVGKDFDRVTLYRNLKLLLENNLIHKIELNNTKTFYTLSNTVTIKKHPHFYCNVCKEVTCLPEETIKNVNLPPGFKKQSINLIISGYCNNCNH